MHVTIRADASSVIGSGHVMRCLTLATALRERGASVSFLCCEHEGHRCNSIAMRGFRVHSLTAPSGDFSRDSEHAYARWLAGTSEEDAAQSRSAIESEGIRPDWIIVDHYGLDQRWEESLRPIAEHVMAIDDLADRSHDCDVLLDQNLVAEMDSRYMGRIPSSCRTLFGPTYALLQPAYAALREQRLTSQAAGCRVVVSFGGADGANLTGRALSALLRIARQDVAIDVVVLSGDRQWAIASELAAGHRNVRLHREVPSLAPLLVDADFAIGAGGATSWERLSLRVPAIVVTAAANQREVAEELSRRGMIRWLGDANDVTDFAMETAVRELLEDRSVCRAMRERMIEVDGRGADRVCEVLTRTA